MAPLTVHQQQQQQASPASFQLGAASDYQTPSRNASTSSHQTSPWATSMSPEGGAQGPRQGPAANGFLCGRTHQSHRVMSPQQPPLGPKASGHRACHQSCLCHRQESKRGGSCVSNGTPQWEASGSHVATPGDATTGVQGSPVQKGSPLSIRHNYKESCDRAHLSSSGNKESLGQFVKDSDKVEDWLAASLVPTPRDRSRRRASCEIRVAESTSTSTTPTTPTTSTTSTASATSTAGAAAAAAVARRQQRAEKHQRVRRLSDVGSDERAVRMLAEAVAESCRQRMADRRKLGAGASLLLADLEYLGEDEEEAGTPTPK